MTDETNAAALGALVDAVWQVLDDMGTDRQSCCLYAKAKLRIAFEPFRESDWQMDMPLSQAAEIVERAEGG